MLCMIMPHRNDNGLVQDIKTTEVVCHSVAMYVSYDMVVEDGDRLCGLVVRVSGYR